MAYQNITVFGGGNAAFAASADLALRGLRVTLCEFPEFENNIRPVMETGKTIDLIGVGRNGVAQLARVTTDLQEAVSGADLILAACQAAGHKKLAERIGPSLTEQQTVLLCPGSCFGAFEFAKTLRDNGVKIQVKIAETNTFVFAARRTPIPNQARIKHIATKVFIAAFPAIETGAILTEFRDLYPAVVPAKDTLETCLLNLNPYIHAVPSVLNIGRIEYSGGEFFLYKEGITPSVAKVMIALDGERIAICRALGYQETTTQQIFYEAGYTKTLTDDLVADYHSSDILLEAKGPFNLQYRYFTEDTAIGITALASLGHALGIPVPLHDALVAITSAVHDTDYAQTCSRTIRNLGLEGVTPAGLRRLFAEGERAQGQGSRP